MKAKKTAHQEVPIAARERTWSDCHKRRSAPGYMKRWLSVLAVSGGVVYALTPVFPLF